jgi:signal transduction histidine kinase
MADSGRGIEEEDLERIFQPFVLEREKRNPEGFGLQLPMARAVMKAMGGGIVAHSDGPGKGSAFTLELATA